MRRNLGNSKNCIAHERPFSLEDYDSSSKPILLMITYKKESYPVVVNLNSNFKYFTVESSGSNILDYFKSQLSETSIFQKSFVPSLKIPKEQIKALKDEVGFNISEIAAILQVKRPTVYEWLESDTPNLRDSNRKRLDEIYNVYEKWAETYLGRLDAYLRRTIINDKSLFDLLSCGKIDHALVEKALASLEHVIREANDAKKLHNNFISKYGLEKNTEKHRENMRKRHRSIS